MGFTIAFMGAYYGLTETRPVDNNTGSNVQTTGVVKIDDGKVSELPGRDLTQTTPVTINIYNGTKYSGLAAQTKITLESLGYLVGEIGNADRQDYTLTIIKYKTIVGETEPANVKSTLEDKGYIVAEPEAEDGINSDIAVYLGKI